MTERANYCTNNEKYNKSNFKLTPTTEEQNPLTELGRDFVPEVLKLKTKLDPNDSNIFKQIMTIDIFTSHTAFRKCNVESPLL